MATQSPRRAWILLLCIPVILWGSLAVAQPAPPTKNAPGNPCQPDPNGTGYRRCGTAGQTVAWRVEAVNRTNAVQTVTFTDGAPLPAGCMDFVCPPMLYINGIPQTLPPGSTCDPAGGITIPGIVLQPGDLLGVDFGGVLDPALPVGATCANSARVAGPTGGTDSIDPDPNCQSNPGRSAPTVITICGGSSPGLDIQKSVSPAGGVGAGDTLAYSLEVCNTGNVPAADVFVSDPIPQCTTYASGSMTLDGSPLTDADDGDGATLVMGIPPVAFFALQDFLGGPLDPGACVTARFEVRVVDCSCGVISNTASGSIGGGVPVVSNTVESPCNAPIPTLVKSADPPGGVQPGDTIAYTLLACNDPSAAADATNVVGMDPIPRCTSFVPESMTVNGVPMTDAFGDDEAEYLPATDRLRFLVGTLAPGECAILTFRVTVNPDCGGQSVENQATLEADGVNPIDSNVTANPVADLRLWKAAGDVNGGTLDPGDTIQYAIEICNGLGRTINRLVLRDAIPGTGLTPPFAASDCDTSYLAGSMWLQPGTMPPALNLTDDCTDGDPGCYEDSIDPFAVVLTLTGVAAGECWTFSFQVRLDAACAGGDCIRNLARVLYDFPNPLLQDSNETVDCVGAGPVAEVYRNRGLASLTETGGCEFGPRLLELACTAIPAVCREDIPALRWTMLGDQVWAGAPLTFYEVHGDGCCAATPPDSRRLLVRKDATGGTDLVVELVDGCP